MDITQLKTLTAAELEEWNRALDEQGATIRETRKAIAGELNARAAVVTAQRKVGEMSPAEKSVVLELLQAEGRIPTPDPGGVAA